MAAIGTLPVLFATGNHAGRPAAAAVGKGGLYSCTTHSLVYQTDGSSWSTWATLGSTGSVATDAIWDAAGDLAVGTGADAASKLTIGSNGHVLTSNGTTATWAAASGSGAADPVAEVFGTPDTTFEFAASSLAGLTAMGSPDAEDADTTVPDHLFLRDSGATYAYVGRYLAPPSAPWTAITKVNVTPVNDFNAAGIFVGVGTPGNMDVLTYGMASSTRQLVMSRVTPTAHGSTIASGPTGISNSPFYLGICVNSSTDVDYNYSPDGYVWRTLTVARNPSITIGSVGVAVKAENASSTISAAFDYLRIWNSAKTFPGGS